MLPSEQRPFLGQVRMAGPAPKISYPRPALGQARPSLRGGAPTELNDTTFAQVLSAPMAVVDFWSPGCPHCVTYKPIFQDVSAGVDGKVLMATINVDDYVKAAGDYKIDALPTTIFFANGKEVNRIEGGLDRPGLVAEISRAFGAGMGGTPAVSSGISPSGILSGIALAGILGGVVYLVVTKS